MGRTSNAKERLIETAVGLIRARGYTAVSVDELCKDAGVRKGSFYHFFPSKRDLALAALDTWWENTRVEMLEPAFQPDVPPLDRITRVFQRAVAQQASTEERTGRFLGCPFGNLALEMSSQDEVMREKLEATFAKFTDYFDKALEEAITQGDVPGNLDALETAQALVAYLYGIILMSKTANDVKLMGRLAANALRLVTAPLV